ncbi:uncharacterized protein BO97DRAFT_425907 [Aspergillus homomorphus CBS 101889]|uniref:Uncharacterized protein n=1 Tax=Aspergillus homomorphus (strain CBS 101889) TaxID=1450537 RepID=A0A395HSM7_ASPHC|nr:hypothetical protein BO97DRAFT_425907 [Aspergillus homomorphus CBS 101889]RAL10951.1 hypothetical protein BO97DRAFT_425907 [Aspergillus homomorphus CBS 101889]
MCLHLSSVLLRGRTIGSPTTVPASQFMNFGEDLAPALKDDITDWAGAQQMRRTLQWPRYSVTMPAKQTRFPSSSLWGTHFGRFGTRLMQRVQVAKSMIRVRGEDLIIRPQLMVVSHRRVDLIPADPLGAVAHQKHILDLAEVAHRIRLLRSGAGASMLVNCSHVSPNVIMGHGSYFRHGHLNDASSCGPRSAEAQGPWFRMIYPSTTLSGFLQRHDTGQNVNPELHLTPAYIQARGIQDNSLAADNNQVDYDASAHFVVAPTR